MSRQKITVVIVTYNRKQLLLRCVNAVQQQSLKPDKILIVDNCSTDGTGKVANVLAEDDKSITFYHMPFNTGGAGGFHEGIKQSLENGEGWIWLMDDDAEPDRFALEELLNHISSENTIYGSAAVYNSHNTFKLCWPITPNENSTKRNFIDCLDEIPGVLEVSSIPFLGFLIHTRLVKRIGLPEKDYYLSGDDTEYCTRALSQGAKIVIVRTSLILHPVADSLTLKLRRSSIRVLLIPPWKRYYDTRNRILIARKHHGFKLWTQTLPGTLVRLFAVLFYQTGRYAQCKAFILGIFDGLTGRKGIRHQLNE